MAKKNGLLKTLAVLGGAAAAAAGVYQRREEIKTLDPSVRDYEPHLALDGGADGLDFYRDIIEKWRKALAKNGKLFFEVGIGQADGVLRLMRSAGFGDLTIVKDTGGVQRVVSGRICESLEA